MTPGSPARGFFRRARRFRFALLTSQVANPNAKSRIVSLKRAALREVLGEGCSAMAGSRQRKCGTVPKKTLYWNDTALIFPQLGQQVKHG
jgi:hypothetical protein